MVYIRTLLCICPICSHLYLLTPYSQAIPPHPAPWVDFKVSRSMYVYIYGCIYRYGCVCVCVYDHVYIFSSVQSLSGVRLFVTPWTVALQASLSITSSQSVPRLMSIESVMPPNRLILCRPLLLLPSIFLSIRVFSNGSVLRNISLSNAYLGLMSFRMDWLDLLAGQGTLRVFSNTTVQKHQFFGTQLSL